MNPLITEHFQKLNLDIRQKQAGYSRFMDQKVTPDVLHIVTESIIEYVDSVSETFTAKDIETSNYFVEMVPRIFNKPKPGNENTKHEYDKWPAQIISSLRYAGVIEVCGKDGRAILYKIKNIELLQYISTRPQNSYAFLVDYVTKVLQDSGFYRHFEKYRNLYLNHQLDKSNFQELKTKFENFIHTYTEINNEDEPRRIFPKVINVLASEHRVPGTISGRMSQFPFLTSDLVYNRVNFRDKAKAKGVSRKEFEEQELTSSERRDPVQRTAQAKKLIKKLHSDSEVKDQWSGGSATQVHHIFPENEFPQLADRLENLILLTPTQHNTKAHPDNNTGVIDREYQLICLLEKSYSIEKSIESGEFYYSRESFIGVINTGLKINIPYDATFENIRNQLKAHYSS